MKKLLLFFVSISIFSNAPVLGEDPYDFYKLIQQPLVDPRFIKDFPDAGLYVVKYSGGPDDPLNQAIDHHAVTYVSDGRNLWKIEYRARTDPRYGQTVHWVESTYRRGQTSSSRQAALVHFESLPPRLARRLAGLVNGPNKINGVIMTDIGEGYLLPSQMQTSDYRATIGQLGKPGGLASQQNCYQLPSLMCNQARSWQLHQAACAGAQVYSGVEQGAMGVDLLTRGLGSMRTGYESGDPVEYLSGASVALAGTSITAQAVATVSTPWVAGSGLAATVNAGAGGLAVSSGAGALMLGTGLVFGGIGYGIGTYTTGPLADWITTMYLQPSSRP